MPHLTYVRQAVQQYSWKEFGSITTSQTALTTDKSSATINALTATGIVIISLVDNTVSCEIRFRCDGSNNDSNTLVLYGIRGTDHYRRMGTLTLTNGTQTDGTYTFIDTIDIANEKWGDDIRTLSDGGDDIASIELNTHGYSKFLLIATTLNSIAIYVDYVRV